MFDNTSKRSPARPCRISVDEDCELRFEMDPRGVTEQPLTVAVLRGGAMFDGVMRDLDKPA